MKKIIKKLLICLLTISCLTLTACDDSNVIVLSDDATNMSETEYKLSCMQISYDDFRYEEQYKRDHTKIKCTGEVTQIINAQDADSEYYSEYRISITKGDYGLWDDDIYVYYMLGYNPKLLEGDIVTMYGEAFDSVTYETVSDASRTIPAMVAVYVDIN